MVYFPDCLQCIEQWLIGLCVPVTLRQQRNMFNYMSFKVFHPLEGVVERVT